MLPAESITYSSDLRSEDGRGGEEDGGELTGEGNGQHGGGFTVTKCRGQAGCVVRVLISQARGAHVARTLTLK